MKKIVLSSVLAASIVLTLNSCGGSKDTNKLVGENGSKDNTKVELGDKSTNQSSSTDTVSFTYDKSAMQGRAIHIKISGKDYSIISIVGDNQYFDIIDGDIYPKDTTPNKTYNLQLNLKNSSTNETKKLNLNLTVADGNNNSTDQNSSSDNNNTDNNTTNNSGTDNNAGNSSTDDFVVGANYGRATWSSANQECKTQNMVLPTEEWLIANASKIKAEFDDKVDLDGDDTKDKFTSALWSSFKENAYVLIKADETTDDGLAESSGDYFFVCVPKAQ